MASPFELGNLTLATPFEFGSILLRALSALLPFDFGIILDHLTLASPFDFGNIIAQQQCGLTLATSSAQEPRSMLLQVRFIYFRMSAVSNARYLL